MTAYIVQRIVHLVPVLLVVSALVFFIFRIVPGDTAVMRLGEQADPQAVAQMRHVLGLDRPLPIQYVAWLGGALHGDLGKSYINQQSVFSLVMEKFPPTLELAVLGMVLALAVSLPIGIVSALRRGTWVDHLARLLALVGFCVPRYWLAVLLILYLAVDVRWFPPAGYVALRANPLDNLHHAALPAISLALTIAAVQMRFLRASVLDVAGQDYIRTAWAKGLGARTVTLGHMLKNALIPFITVVGLEFGSLLGGLVVVEQIFAWPGIGWLTIQAITQRDYAVVQGAVLLIASGVVVINLVVDIAYAYVDPRIRYA